ncbi:MAG: penicillin-binding transpeptidase domain-containing protein, partial [Geminicoccaceae bacterium]
MIVLDENAVDRRRAPWSTFKIPNLIIALETGVATDLAHWRDWNQHRPAANYWPTAWKQGHSLASAFKRSVVWYFQEIALEVGTTRYRKDLLRFGYGNASVPMHSDDFWLGGPLIISPREQTHFLKRVLDGSLVISDRTRDMLREVSLIKSAGDYALHGKSGSGRLEGSGVEGWFVGWVERARTPIATFALHLRAPDFRSLRDARFYISEKLLRTAGYLPQDWK